MAMAEEAKIHVLAVDDSLLDRKLIEQLLKISSYNVTVVDSGSKALQVLGLQEDEHTESSHRPLQEMEVNLIITDYCMPGMSGYDLLRKVKESNSVKDIPVVIMSSDNVPSRISRCLEEGAEEFLLKPIRLSDVSRLKHHVMRGRPREPTAMPSRTGQSLSSKDVLKWEIQMAASAIFFFFFFFCSASWVSDGGLQR